MRHRSVIAFVIVAAALFALPQLSHDLQTLKGSVGSRLRGELLQAFLSLHTDDAAATTETATSPSRVPALVASCTKVKADAPAAKSKKGEPRASLESRGDATSAESAREQMALTTPRRVETNGEVAMIIPPDSGIDPHALADLSAAWSKAHDASAQQPKMAEELRHVAYVTTRFEGNNVEWRKAGEEALRSLNARAVPGTFEFRLVHDGSKTKVLKFIKRSGDAGHQPAAAVPAPRAPRVLPGQVARLAPGAQASSEDE